MLVLTRKLMEKLFIGDDICVTVVRLEGGQVRLGIDAPRDVSVVRAELVPERQSASPRANSLNNHGRGLAPQAPTVPPGVAAPGPIPAPGPTVPRSEAGIRIPRASIHENDSRRRGQSR